MTGMTSHLALLLDTLGSRAREQGKGLSDAVGVVGDLGRVLARGSEAEVRDVQAAVAALRERLEVGEVDNQPVKALDGHNGHAYLAGALWAINELMSAQLDVVDAARTAEPTGTRRSQVERVVLAALDGTVPRSPKDIAESPEGAAAGLRNDEISRALSGLLAAGRAEVVDPASPDTDRRRKYFRLVH
ncbi:hypothetical protein [Nocardioides sp. LML1-1-1.1]|uniref:hypothetical protein n=1 Tax=Nocardioides sp. LML1-1-1.1 TaxID=3135248 RepID=UPI003414A012